MPWPFFIFVYLYFFCAFCPAHDFFLICYIYPRILRAYSHFPLCPLKKKKAGNSPAFVFYLVFASIFFLSFSEENANEMAIATKSIQMATIPSPENENPALATNG